MGKVIDCFAGGGGASTGIEQALGRPCDVAVNHDPKAIAMHRANHPMTHHVTEDIFDADLRHLVGDRPVELMWASPDCTHHSRAKGGKPREKRASHAAVGRPQTCEGPHARCHLHGKRR